MIGDRGARTDHDRLRVGAQFVRVGACEVSGEPARRSVGRRDPTIDAGRNLGDHEGTAGAAMVQIWRQRSRRASCADADGHVDPRGAELSESGARHVRIGIFERGDHSGDPSRDQRVDTRRGASPVRTRLERDVGGGAAGAVAGLGQSADLGVRSTGRFGGTDPDDLAVADERASHPRIGRTSTAGGLAGCERLLHRFVVAHGVPRANPRGAATTTVQGRGARHRLRARLS